MGDPGSAPAVSLLMPAYGNAQFIDESIRSLLAQEHSDFELLISDDVSPDETGDICSRHVDQDARVDYIRQPKNLGSVDNFDYLLKKARGRYVAWTTDHDLWDPKWLERCVGLLDVEPSVAIVQSRTKLISDHGSERGLAPDQFDTRRMTAADRYRSVIRDLSWLNIFHGVMRRDAMLSAGPYPRMLSGDNLLLANLALHWEFAHIPEPLFIRRENRDYSETSEAHKNRVLRMTFLERANELHRVPKWRHRRVWRNAHLDLLPETSLSFRERLELARDTIDCFNLRRQV